MYLIQQITSTPYQRQTQILADGSSLVLTLRYRPNQFGWFIEELDYKAFTLTGMRIVNSPNLLHQYLNQIPFGLACISQENREPTLSPDFSSGASKLYVLTAAECQAFAGYLAGG